MKHILTTTILVATAFVTQADDRSISEKARDAAGAVVDKTKEVARETKKAVVRGTRRADRATREAWDKTKAYFSDDMPVFREGASAALAGLGREIADVKARTPAAAPAYFRTRLMALDEQHDYLGKRLALLSHEQLRNRASGPRHEFDRCLGDLEQAIDQAEDGIGVIATLVSR